MDLSAQQFLLPIVVVALMVCVGMELQWQQFRSLLSAPRTLVLGSLIHTFTFPLLALAMVAGIKALDLPTSEAILIGTLLIAACPSGGFSNVMALMARANLPLSVALTTVSSLLSFVTVPLFMVVFAVFISTLNASVSLPVGSTLIQLLVLIVLPIGAGMLLRLRFPAFVDTHLGRLQRVGQLIFYAVLALVLVENFDTIFSGVGEALPWSLLLCLTNIAGCYFVGKWVGLDAIDRVTVALEGSIRNLAVALLIAVNVMQRPDIAALPTVYFMAVILVAITFAKTWRRWVNP